MKAMGSHNRQRAPRDARQLWMVPIRDGPRGRTENGHLLLGEWCDGAAGRSGRRLPPGDGGRALSSYLNVGLIVTVLVAATRAPDMEM